MLLKLGVWAVRATTPVFILSEGFLANSAEPWKIVDPDDIAPIIVAHPTGSNTDNGFLPYKRDPETLGRPWAIPGTPGLEHRLGGLAKQPETGNVSYDPDENEQMVRERIDKVARLAEAIPAQDVYGPESGDLLVLSWGGTFGAVRSAVMKLQQSGKSVSHTHLRYINPFPKNLDDVIERFDHILVTGVEFRSVDVSASRQISSKYVQLSFETAGSTVQNQRSGLGH